MWLLSYIPPPLTTSPVVASPVPSTIDTITIRQDAEGRYCLNDLHKAAGDKLSDKPANFLRQCQTEALVKALLENEQCPAEPLKVINGGKGRGTYVVREVVYAYAMWISPAFHLKVIRAYDRLATQGVAVHENAAEDLLKNPLKYLEAIIGQAKELQAQLAIAAPKAEIFDTAFSDDSSVALTKFVRTFDGVNTLAIKKDLVAAGIGYYTPNTKKFRVYSKYRDSHFTEKVNSQYGTFDVFVTPKGMELVAELYKAGRLTKKKH